MTELDGLIDKALEFSNKQEQRILENGRRLTDQELKDGDFVGLELTEPDTIRIMSVPRIPSPDDQQLMQIARENDFNFSRMDGITFNRGIYITENRKNDRALIVHELTHVVQWDRLGKRNFLEQYLPEIIEHGHGPGELEQEAKEKAGQFRRGS